MQPIVLLLALAVSAAALATPRHFNRAAHLAHVRAAIPAPILDVPTEPVPSPSVKRTKFRRQSKLCKPRPSNSPSTLSSDPAPTSTSAAAVPPANPGGDPSTSSQKSAPTSQAPANPAPAPSSTKKDPAPSPSKQPTPTSAAPPANTAGKPSYLFGTQTGQGTFYSTGLGSCGITNQDTDFIAAVSHLLYDTFPGYNGVNPNSNPVCGQKVTANYQGKSVTVAITDRCTGCAITDLDFSPSAFNQLADPSVGRISGMTWTWNNPDIANL